MIVPGIHPTSEKKANGASGTAADKHQKDIGQASHGLVVLKDHRFHHFKCMIL